MDVTAVPKVFQEWQQVRTSWVINWSGQADLFRRLGALVENEWQHLPEGSKAKIQLFIYHPASFQISLPRQIWIAFSMGVAYFRNDLTFLDYMEEVTRFRRIVLATLVRHDPTFQKLKNEAIVNALKEIKTNPETWQSEQDMDTWFDAQRRPAPKIP